MEFIDFTYKRKKDNDKSDVSTAFDMLESFIKSNEKRLTDKNIKHSSRERLLTLTESTTAIDSNENSKQIGSFSEIKKDINKPSEKNISNFRNIIKPLTIEVNDEKVAKSQRFFENNSPIHSLFKNNKMLMFSTEKNKHLINPKNSPKNQEKHSNQQNLNKIVVNKVQETNKKNSSKNIEKNCLSPRLAISSTQNIVAKKETPKLTCKEAFSSKNVLKKIEINILDLGKRKCNEKIKLEMENDLVNPNNSTSNEQITTKCYVNDFNGLESKINQESSKMKRNKLHILNDFVKNNLIMKTKKNFIQSTKTKANLIKTSNPVQSKSGKN